MLTYRFPIVAILGIVASVALAAAAPVEEGATAGRGPMEAWWADLEKEEEPASRALLKMSTRPEEAVAFLKVRMKPLTIKAGEVRGLLLKVGSRNEKVWKPAFEELEYFDPRLAIDLETLMERITETPARQRMVEVLSGREAGSLGEAAIQLHNIGGGRGFNFVARGSWWAEHRVERLNSDRWGTYKKKWARAVRALVLLEHIGTPDALAILKAMATGHPDAQPTKVAKEALERVAAKVR
jgi:hypothetical protein